MLLHLEASASPFHNSPSEAMTERKSFPIPKPPKHFKPEEGCYAPGADGLRCGNLKLVSKGLCSTHYNMARWTGELAAPRPRAEDAPNAYRAHGLTWSSKRAAMEVEKLAKDARMSISLFISSSVEEKYNLAPKAKRKAVRDEG
ncbi:hypothetical protein FJV41_23940 [Myxococcus llanfairpwllgwyngyllgogerychwyrndrobwllllantysiliogogogochensis]|uniref:Uncharacterized protein n=1 Tax=Myxococcus llanfairpwllgwyngyllgogerychwyrndrobwllllantysiliogogogochensis TaxID=2590453 RepID=A0A540WYD8_9BACT|nr:hypothetical protein [Myxococcus llanfairpwllgwyngyllgogerychwyrndrobwllllantysiliogogogochensis]TQF13444.1 hypothetical protein FJV41_23940 [Myxococcus llanfairpwllgwyngyllgogerychwyrndrobwllllantysiliogogogochensis]